MLIVKCAPVADNILLPDMGDELTSHIMAYNNIDVRLASCSAWRLLYDTIIQENITLFDVAFDSNGKPYARQGDVFFSITHSAGMCAIALSDVAVGIDIERTDRRISPRMIRRVFSDKEISIFSDNLIRAWCRKECIAKLTGEGIVDFPCNIDITDCRYGFADYIVTHEAEEYNISVAYLSS